MVGAGLAAAGLIDVPPTTHWAAALRVYDMVTAAAPDSVLPVPVGLLAPPVEKFHWVVCPPPSVAVTLSLAQSTPMTISPVALEIVFDGVLLVAPAPGKEPLVGVAWSTPLKVTAPPTTFTLELMVATTFAVPTVGEISCHSSTVPFPALMDLPTKVMA